MKTLITEEEAGSALILRDLNVPKWSGTDVQAEWKNTAFGEDTMGFERHRSEEPVFLPGRLMESCEDDVALAHEILQDFQQSAPNSLARLAAATAASDAAAVRLVAHSLKGSSRTVGAEALAAACAQMETAVAGGNLADVPGWLAEAERRFHDLNDVLSAYLANKESTRP